MRACECPEPPCTCPPRRVCPDGAHEWTDWARAGFIRDSLGHVIGAPGVAVLKGGDPVTPGWLRVCRQCPTEETV